MAFMNIWAFKERPDFGNYFRVFLLLNLTSEFPPHTQYAAFVSTEWFSSHSD